MKKNADAVCIIVLCAMGLVFFQMLGGCDGQDQFQQTLTIWPSDTTLTLTSSQNVTLTAVSNTSEKPPLPIQWTLSSTDLGSIVSASDYTATYQSSGKFGVNTVTAVDQAGHTGYATITQTEGSYALTLSASPSATLSSSNLTCAITVSGGISPYTWGMADTSLGTFVGGTSGSTVVYESNGTSGVNVITASDAYDVNSSIVITL